MHQHKLSNCGEHVLTELEEQNVQYTPLIVSSFGRHSTVLSNTFGPLLCSRPLLVTGCRLILFCGDGSSPWRSKSGDGRRQWCDCAYLVLGTWGLTPSGKLCWLLQCAGHQMNTWFVSAVVHAFLTWLTSLNLASDDLAPSARVQSCIALRWAWQAENGSPTRTSSWPRDPVIIFPSRRDSLLAPSGLASCLRAPRTRTSHIHDMWSEDLWTRALREDIERSSQALAQVARDFQGFSDQT